MIHLAALLASSPTTTVAGHAAKSSGSLLDPIAKPIAWVLAEIYSLIPNYGVAIMVLSIIWMVLISPLTLKSTRSMLAMQKLQPQLKRLQAQHGSDRQAFAAAQMELFREHQVSPFGSCLPMLLPMPVFFALFRVIDGLSHSVKPVAGLYGCNPATMTKCWDPKYLSSSSQMFKDIAVAHGHLNAFGMDLSRNALSAHNGFLAALPFWIVLLVMAGTSYYQSAQMMNRNKEALAQNPQMRMMKYLPLLFVVFCIRFPAGVIVYYAMSNVCRIVQQDFMYRFDPKVKALVAQEVEEVEELTHEIDEGRPSRSAPKPKGGGGKDAGGSKGSRFGNLLAQAAEQQQRSAQAKAAGKGSSGKASPNGSSSGNGKAATGKSGSSSGRSSNGSSNARKRQPRPGGRTNRKRRGKR